MNSKNSFYGCRKRYRLFSGRKNEQIKSRLNRVFRGCVEVGEIRE